MPIRAGSRLRQTRVALYGWKKDGAYCLSLEPRENNKPVNTYKSSAEALKEASTRHLPIKWEE